MAIPASETKAMVCCNQSIEEKNGLQSTMLENNNIIY